ncbi:MAG TPA: nucleotidyl transferase AbiEii/AbiGii toxin family protein, partial [Pyrinomonadaceae bacterium]
QAGETWTGRKTGVLFLSMLNAGVLTFGEFAMREQLPLASIHDAVLEFLRGREDAVLFGAQAVNAYVAEPRMSQDIDLVSTRAAELAEELRQHLSERFHIAVRVRAIGNGKGYRLFQIQQPRNRHLVDLRTVESLPHAERIEDVLVTSPPDLIAQKVISYHARRGQPKAGTDWRDLAMLLLTFPELKQEQGLVSEVLKSIGVKDDVMQTWRELIEQKVVEPEDDNEFE